MNDYIALTKPRITWLILMSTAVGYFFGLPEGLHGPIQWMMLFHTIVGTGLIASGTAALNQWYERDADRKMKRTEHRPLPSGKMPAANAMWFGIALAVVGFLELWLGVNLLTALLGMFTLGSYLFLYTPLKQRSALATVIGALPGAMPPMIGFAAAAGTLSAPAFALGTILFLWQFPHFLAISWMYREDYARAGILMLPVVDPNGHSTSRQMVIYASTLIPASLFPCLLGMTGKVYLVGALLLGGWFLYSGVRVFFDETRIRARQVLLVSVIYLPLIYGLMVLDRPGI
jgi:protoheme IX farnesyltransferase